MPKFAAQLAKKADELGLTGEERERFIAAGLKKDAKTLNRQARLKGGIVSTRATFKGKGALSAVKKHFNRGGSSQ